MILNSSDMKCIQWTCLISLAIFVLPACQKVIHLHLKSSDQPYVIEGVITDQPGTCRVLISRVKPFEDDNTFQGVSGAEVSLSDDGGDTVMLVETGAGVYENSSRVGVAGHTYSLQVRVGGEHFTASSTMPSKVQLDSAYVEEEDFFGETTKQLNVIYRDPAGQSNYYKFVEFVNRRQVQQQFVTDDQLTDGKKVISTLRYFDDKDNKNDVPAIKTGDTLRVDMQCIDAAVYKYWYSLESSATGSSQSASPANPVSNIQGGALGIFSAHTLQQKQVIAP